MPTAVEYIQLEPNDDLAHVRDRLSFIRGKRVLLVWPEDGTAFTRKLDLVLIQREARRRAIQLALVTHDPQVIQHARELEISAFRNVGESERARWRRGRTKVFLPRHHKPPDEPDPQDLLPIASRVRGKRRALKGWQRLLLQAVALLVVATVMTVTAWLVLPSAEVVITLVPQEVQLQTTLTADPNVTDIDVENGIMPSTVLRAEVQTVATIATSGTRSLGDDFAIGTVVFTNLTAGAVEVPANTTLSTSAGTPILFKTIAPVTVPAGVGERAEVGIEALASSSGRAGNVEAGLINTVVGALAERVSVRNLAPTTGGASREVAVVTAQDRERLLAIVRGQLQAVAYDEMLTTLSDSQTIVIETVRIAEERNDWTLFSHAEGEATDTLTLSMKAVVTALTLDERFGRQIVFAQLSAQKPVGKVLQAETFVYTQGAVSEITPQNRVTFSAEGRVMAQTQVMTQNLLERVAGRPYEEALRLVRDYGRLAPQDSVSITLDPPDRDALPPLMVRISLRVENAR
jgi:hypothetical protein